MANDSTPPVLSPSEIRLRRRMFYGAFVLLALLYAAIVGPYMLENTELTLRVMQAIIVVAPEISGDVPVMGDLIPGLLGALIAAAAPTTASNGQLIRVLVVAAATYAIYLHMSIVLAPDNLDPVKSAFGVEMAGFGLAPKEDGETLRSLAAGGRSFAMFVFAGIIGIRFSDIRSVLIPFKGFQPKQQTTVVESPIPPSDESDGAAPQKANG
jgi:hypothetical protein